MLLRFFRISGKMFSGMDAKYFWQRVKKSLSESKKTQRELSEYLGMPLRTLENWMGRGIYPLVPEGYRIAEYLGLSVGFLLTGKETPSDRKKASVRSLLQQAEKKVNKL